MKSSILLTVLLITSFTSSAQDLRTNANFGTIQSLLADWDPIRGEWLTSSFVAMSTNQPIPDRTFPEMLTPAELFTFVPQQTRNRVTELLENTDENERMTQGDNMEIGINVFRMLSMMMVTGRTSWTSGDPHIVTFDDMYFQNTRVGEFSLAKSTTTNFEIQARFQNINDAAAFTTAVSMNVGGDRVALYANEKPDNVSYTALRVNGNATTINSPIYYLPMGGTISYQNGTYTVNWATGESAKIVVKTYADKRYFDVAIQIREDFNSDYTGLTASYSGLNEEERITNAQLNESSSLFQYSSDQSFDYYARQPLKSIKAPKVTSEMRADAKNVCTDAGVSGAAMAGCVSDYARYSIPPSLEPSFGVAADQITLKTLNGPIANTNETVNAIHSAPVIQEVEKEKKRINPNLNNGIILREILRATPQIIINAGGTLIR